MKQASREDQSASQFWTPPRWSFALVTKLQSWVYEESDGRLWSRAMRMHHLLLRTVGRQSGEPRVACLPYWLDENEQRIVVASYGGAPRHPAWYHNLCDRKVNPEVVVRDKRRVFWAEAQVLEGEERSVIWRALTRDRPFFGQYQAQTSRTIPLVRLLERRRYEG